jgi:hypothetical protein
MPRHRGSRFSSERVSFRLQHHRQLHHQSRRHHRPSRGDPNRHSSDPRQYCSGHLRRCSCQTKPSNHSRELALLPRSDPAAPTVRSAEVWPDIWKGSVLLISALAKCVSSSRANMCRHALASATNGSAVNRRACSRQRVKLLVVNVVSHTAPSGTCWPRKREVLFGP